MDGSGMFEVWRRQTVLPDPSQKDQTLPLTGCSPWVFVNGNAAGYYRTQYDKADLQKLIAIAGTELTTAERISLLRDQAALVGSGQQSMATYLDLISAMSQDAQHEVVESYLPTLDYVNNYLLSGRMQHRFAPGYAPTLGQ